MSAPTSSRSVRLIDARTAGRPLVDADLYLDFPAAWLELEWEAARAHAAASLTAAGGMPLEHDHWDWRHKAQSVQAGAHLLAVVAVETEPQGAMAVKRLPQAGRLGGGHVMYVDYVEAAPWNLKGLPDPPKYSGVGLVLLAEAFRLSEAEGLGGRVGLHSLPQAEGFYDRCGMTRVGTDPGYYGLTYFEYTGQQAAAFLAGVEGT